MATALRVIAGGWTEDEARVEALAFMDEVASEAERLASLIAEIEREHLACSTNRDLRFRRGIHQALRMVRKATLARIEFAGLTDGGIA